MREIKFRVWDTILKYYVNINDFVLELDGGLLKLENINAHQMSYIVGVDDSTFIVEQYTGLKDKNGVEIYEGDLLQKNDVLYEVYFDNGMFCAMIYIDGETFGGVISLFDLLENYECEVIGNIHETK